MINDRSQWAKATQMQREQKNVQHSSFTHSPFVASVKVIQGGWKSEEAHGPSQWRESTQLHRIQKVIQPNQNPQLVFAHSY